MTVIGWIQILLYCAIVLALVKPLGWYMTRVFNSTGTLYQIELPGNDSFHLMVTTLNADTACGG